MLAQNYQSKRCTLHGENIERIITTGRTSYKAIGWAVLLLSTLIGCLPSAQAVDVLFREKDELDQINFVLENHELSHPSFQQILSLTSSAEATSVAYGEVYSSNYNLSALEINALEDLYNATNGKSWNWRYPYDIYGQRWNFSTQIVNPCNDSWQGIVCGSSFGSVELHVKNLSLNSMGLSGVLPASISNLSELSVLNLNNNSLTGVFPDSVPSLANLTELILSSNNLTGPIPRNLLANLSQLRVLLLSENKLEGELFDIQEGYGAQLGLLSLEKNMLVDKFPENIKFLRNLELFTIGRNSFSGSIPESIGELKNLTVLGVNNNHLQGHLPSSIANCSRLEYLYAEENLFEGQIWQNIELLPNLVYISIYENSLTGPIPNGIGNLTQLRALVLDNNYFTGSIPTSIGNCTFLQQLTIYNNILTGELPPELSSLSYLELVLLQNNRFVGKPGPAFDRDRQLLLYSVDISQNDFTGVLPDSFFAPNLTSFAAFENCFAGKLPDAICNSGKLEVLVLDGIGTGRHCRRKYWPTIADSPYYTKAIEGAIPSCVWTDLPSLQTMHISGNGLTGEIPMLESYGNLTDLDLSYNRMSGEIPLQLQTWSQLTNLDLSNNRFCGEITGMSQLKYSYSTKEDGISLSLSINRLSGIIPTEIEYAQNIQIVSGNLFSCSYYHQPPIHDPDSTTYVCGSNLLDISLWFFSVGGGLWVLTVVFLLVSVGMVAKHLLFGSNLALASRSSTLVKDGDNQQTTSIHATILADKAEGVVESSNLNIWNRLCDLVYYYYYFFVLSSSTFIINQIHSLPDKSIGASALYLLYWWKFLDEVVSMDYCNIKYCAFDDRIEISPVSAENSCVRRVSIVQDLKLAKVSVELLQIAYGGKRSTHLCLLLKVIRLLRIVALIMVLLIILVTIPSYLALKKYFGTYANQYRWEISGAFLEGKESACFVLTAWIVLLAIVLTAIQRYIPNRKNPIHGENGAVEQSTTNSGIKNVSTYSSSTLDTPQTFTVKEKSDPSADSPVKDGAVRLGVSFDSKSLSALVEENSTNTITSRKSSSVLKFFEERRSKIGKMISRIKRRSWWIGIFALLLNSTVVMALKTSAIFLLVSSKSDFEVKLALECSISALDVVWMVILVPYMISRLPQVTQLGKFLLKVSMLFFNSLVAPSLAIAGTDSSCFQGLFKQQPNSEDVFYFSYCTFYLPGSSEETCYKSSSWSSVVYYRPPFYYNFSCYSAILTAYIPITFLSYTILSVSIPAVSWFLTTRKKPSAIHNCFPKIYLIENEASIEFNMLEETKGNMTCTSISIVFVFL